MYPHQKKGMQKNSTEGGSTWKDGMILREMADLQDEPSHGEKQKEQGQASMDPPKQPPSRGRNRSGRVPIMTVKMMGLTLLPAGFPVCSGRLEEGGVFHVVLVRGGVLVVEMGRQEGGGGGGSALRSLLGEGEGEGGGRRGWRRRPRGLARIHGSRETGTDTEKGKQALRGITELRSIAICCCYCYCY